MKKGTVIKNDDVWHGHPDVAYFNDELFIAFRESAQHMARNATSIQLIRKSNSFSDPITIAKSPHRFNCPRLSVVNNQLWIICDQVEKSHDYIRSENDDA